MAGQVTLPITERLKVAEGILSRQVGMIRASDNKVTAIFAFQTGAIALLATQSDGLVRTLRSHAIDVQSIIFVTLLIIFAAFLARSFLYSFRALYPHVISSYRSLIFFGTIPESRDAFREAFFNLTEEQLEEDLSANIVTTAQIARLKFRFVKRSIQSLAVSVVAGILLVVLLDLISL